MQATRICFVRHGETDWNIEQRMQGHLDLALNARGEAQAIAVGNYFQVHKRQPYTAVIFCAPDKPLRRSPRRCAFR